MSENIISLTSEESAFSVTGALIVFEFELFGHTFYVTETVFIQLFVTFLLGLLFFALGRNLKLNPTSKKQVFVETIVTFFGNTVRDTMGVKYKNYTCYITALFFISLLSSLMGLLGLKPPTSELSVVGTWGIITFILVTRNKFKTGGVKGYFGSFVEPMKFMLPFNIIGEFANPLSQTVRHFANILAGTVLGGLIYFSLSALAYGLAAIGIPAVLSLYFDIFTAVIQAYIFMMLTMVYVAMGDTSSDN
ncbi:MAG: F0F1 ATP synthase subunit A [Oscillospiraceae bacterium]|nr:F0F1 ATP synthase subunit A [Oscillospiraceae bacterium]